MKTAVSASPIRAAAPGLSLFMPRLLRRSVLTAEEQAAILALPAETAAVEANRDFVGQGEATRHACLVVDGLTARFAQTASGDRQIIAFHIPGDMADMHSLIAPSAPSALQALTRSTIVRVPHMALRALSNRYPAVAQAFWRDTIVDAGIIAQSLLSLGRRDAGGRVAHLLCEMAIRYEQVGMGEDGRYVFPATQGHIADALGLTAVHVNRTLRALREDGLVEVRGKDVRVLDRARLAKRAEFDANYLQLEQIDFHTARPGGASAASS